MTIADKIYELRSSRNMSLREFAQLAGVTHTTIARLEADTYGTQKVYLDTLYLICKNLNYDFNKFLNETGYLKNTDTTAAPMGDTLTREERELVQGYRGLDDKLKKLVRDSIKVYSGDNELIFNPDKKV
ncbi:MAG: helix-turn-helix domain-containing protein [Clostridia bacterium]|nr:helix-turn-helix domain-containing protein [Clostridia bacterium]